MHDIDLDAGVFRQLRENIIAHVRKPTQAFGTDRIDQEHQSHKALVAIEIFSQRLIPVAADADQHNVVTELKFKALRHRP